MTQVNRFVLPASAAAVGAIVTVLDVLDLHSPLRAIAAVLFVVLGPGAAWIGMVRLPDTVTEITAAIGLSLTAAVLITSVQIYTGTWSPPRTLVYLVALTFLGALLQLAPPSVLGVRDLVSPRAARRLHEIAVSRHVPLIAGAVLLVAGLAVEAVRSAAPHLHVAETAAVQSRVVAFAAHRSYAAISNATGVFCVVLVVVLVAARALLQTAGAATARLRLLHAACLPLAAGALAIVILRIVKVIAA
jgi:hypothetical protein